MLTTLSSKYFKNLDRKEDGNSLLQIEATILQALIHPLPSPFQISFFGRKVDSYQIAHFFNCKRKKKKKVNG